MRTLPKIFSLSYARSTWPVSIIRVGFFTKWMTVFASLLWPWTGLLCDKSPVCCLNLHCREYIYRLFHGWWARTIFIHNEWIMTYLLSEQNSKINISLFSLKGKQRAVKPPHSSRLALKWLPCKILYNTRTCVGVCVCCDRRKKQRDYTFIPSLFVIALLSGDFVKYIRTIVYMLYKFA